MRPRSRSVLGHLVNCQVCWTTDLSTKSRECSSFSSHPSQISPTSCICKHNPEFLWNLLTQKITDKKACLSLLAWPLNLTTQNIRTNPGWEESGPGSHRLSQWGAGKLILDRSFCGFDTHLEPIRERSRTFQTSTLEVRGQRWWYLCRNKLWGPCYPQRKRKLEEGKTIWPEKKPLKGFWV